MDNKEFQNRLNGMIDMVEFKFAHKSADDDIAVIKYTSQRIAFHTDGKDGAERRFFAAVVQADHFFQPDHALIGDNVIIVAPVNGLPEAPAKSADKRDHSKSVGSSGF